MFALRLFEVMNAPPPKTTVFAGHAWKPNCWDPFGATMLELISTTQ